MTKFFSILLLSLTTLSITACQTAQNRPLHLDTRTNEGVMRGSRSTEAYCKEALSSVWVTVDDRSECIRYYAAGLQEQNETIVVHIHGDVGAVRIASGDMVRVESFYENLAKSADRIVNSLVEISQLPTILLARPGTFGSSGYHGDRLGLINRQILNAALDAIKARHNVESFALSGQSGGGTVVASILTMRSDIRCAVLGAAAASLKETIYASNSWAGPDRIGGIISDPFDTIDQIPHDPNRTIYVIGDRDDGIVKFSAQRSFAVRTANYGHKVVIIPVESSGRMQHGTSRQAISVATACAKGLSPDKVKAAAAGS